MSPKFIEIHISGQSRILNTYHIAEVGKRADGCAWIHYDTGASIVSDESYEDILERLSTSTGERKPFRPGPRP